MRRVRLAQARELARPLGLLLGVLADRLEHPPARRAGSADAEQRAVDERAEQVEDLVGVHAVAGAHRLDRVERRAGGEHGEPPGEPPLGLAQEVPAPVDDRAQRPLTARRGAAAPGEQAEAVVQAVGELLERHRPQPGGGELDRQRQAVDPPAHVRDDRRRRLVEREVGRRRRGALGEQQHGRLLLQRPDGGERLAADGERLAARRQDPQPRAAGEQAIGELRRGHDDVLAVVEHEQRVARAERVEQPRLRVGRRRPAVRHRRLAEAERAEHRGREALAVAERRELDEPRRPRAHGPRARARGGSCPRRRSRRASRAGARERSPTRAAGPPPGRRSSSARPAGCRAVRAPTATSPRRTARCASCSTARASRRARRRARRAASRRRRAHPPGGPRRRAQRPACAARPGARGAGARRPARSARRRARRPRPARRRRSAGRCARRAARRAGAGRPPRGSPRQRSQRLGQQPAAPPGSPARSAARPRARAARSAARRPRPASAPAGSRRRLLHDQRRSPSARRRRDTSDCSACCSSRGGSPSHTASTSAPGDTGRAGVDREPRQERLQPAAGDLARRSVVLDEQWTQDRDVHG